MLVLAGRAPTFRWGSGSLQEIDHIPLVSAVTKKAATVTSTDGVAAALHDAALTALTPHRGPVFLDLPLDVVFSFGEASLPDSTAPVVIEPDPADVAKAAALLAGPRIMASEDYALFAQRVPSTYFFVGAGDEASGKVYDHHHPKFDIDERSLTLGVELMARSALRYLTGA